ncbi:winged helix-turn-helix transcriptional regulator [Weissella coleopterorum]|uniref:Winged helix-turn-helix transcriptional regulator n=1 Tax=Weissella coleopterorum TaxID=2714949 RepID=A0A6G8AYH2_9LACO|nr:metalloregulator ArsR/SmtB family transcription factor [Weissella coleopterorum]QIL50047.1 winged helix-turn-helix transcriptional regulator [Weissella coleopterorum]
MTENIELINETQKILKVLSNSTRLNILLLLEHNSLSVNELVQKLKVSQPAISKQLNILKKFQIVTFKQQGTTNFYKLDDLHILTVIKSTMDHAQHILNNQKCDNN